MVLLVKLRGKTLEHHLLLFSHCLRPSALLGKGRAYCWRTAATVEGACLSSTCQCKLIHSWGFTWLHFLIYGDLDRLSALRPWVWCRGAEGWHLRHVWDGVELLRWKVLSVGNTVMWETFHPAICPSMLHASKFSASWACLSHTKIYILSWCRRRTYIFLGGKTGIQARWKNKNTTLSFQLYQKWWYN